MELLDKLKFLKEKGLVQSAYLNIEKWLKNENTKNASQQVKDEKSEQIRQQNLKEIEKYIYYRERVGAMGNLHYNDQSAWDEKSNFKWSLSNENVMSKIRDFYGQKQW